MNATYNYSEYLYERGYQRKSAPVEIVKETAKQYLVKLLGVWVGRHAPGTTMWVNKSNVAVEIEKQTIDCSKEWWNQ